MWSGKRRSSPSSKKEDVQPITVEYPREECLAFENTHPALITQEVWDIVQRARKNKRRRTNMDEQNKYSGLVLCAGCGSIMVLHRAHTMSASYNHFTCRTYVFFYPLFNLHNLLYIIQNLGAGRIHPPEH